MFLAKPGQDTKYNTYTVQIKTRNFEHDFIGVRGRTGNAFVLMWQASAELVRSARAGDQFSISTWCFLSGWQPLDKLFPPGSRPGAT
jgi:hypothetical protein